MHQAEAEDWIVDTLIQQPESAASDEKGKTVRIVPGAEWSTLHSRARSTVPEAFDSAGRVLNLVEGEWGHPGHGKR